MTTSLKKQNSPKRTSSAAFAPKRVLVPIDFSELADEAVVQAVQIASHSGATILLLHVVEPVVYPVDSLVVPAAMEDANLQLVQNSKKKLSEIQDEVALRGVKCEAATLLGKPYHQIVETARKKKIDLIVLPTHGHTGLKHIYLGSTAEKVVRHAPCSVLVVR
jgi:universal stress protein A